MRTGCAVLRAAAAAGWVDPCPCMAGRARDRGRRCTYWQVSTPARDGLSTACMRQGTKNAKKKSNANRAGQKKGQAGVSQKLNKS